MPLDSRRASAVQLAEMRGRAVLLNWVLAWGHLAVLGCTSSVTARDAPADVPSDAPTADIASLAADVTSPALPDLSAPKDASAPAPSDIARDLGPGDALDAVDSPDIPDVPSPPVLKTGTQLLWLDHGAFPQDPAHPSALLYVPAAFDPTPPVALVVYLHGHNNCVTNIVGKTSGPCTPGGKARTAFALIEQLESSQRNALLLCPELAFDLASSAPGALGVPDGLLTFVTEVLATMSPPMFVPGDLGPIVVASHSGGYAAAAALATVGGLPVSQVWLFDSLYAKSAEFESWLKDDLDSFATPGWSRRFMDVYTDGGGTADDSQALAATVAPWFGPNAFVHDTTFATWTLDQYDHGVLFKRSMLSHDGVPKYYFRKLLETSGLGATL